MLSKTFKITDSSTGSSLILTYMNKWKNCIAISVSAEVVFTPTVRDVRDSLNKSAHQAMSASPSPSHSLFFSLLSSSSLIGISWWYSWCFNEADSVMLITHLTDPSRETSSEAQTCVVQTKGDAEQLDPSLQPLVIRDSFLFSLFNHFIAVWPSSVLLSPTFDASNRYCKNQQTMNMKTAVNLMGEGGGGSKRKLGGIKKQQVL